MLKNVLNVTPHPLSLITLTDGTLYEVPPCGVVLNAGFEDAPAGVHEGDDPVEVVYPDPVPDPKSAEDLDRLERDNPFALIVGSYIAAQAFPGRVKSPIAAPGFERRPPAEKRMRDDKFSTGRPRS